MDSIAKNEEKRAFPNYVKKGPAKLGRKTTPPPAKVYNVDPIGFRHLVQTLTGANPKSPGNVARKSFSGHAPSLDQFSGGPLSSFFSPEKQLQAPEFGNMEWGVMDLPEGFGGNPTRDDFYSRSEMISFESQPSMVGSWSNFPVVSPGSLHSVDYGKFIA
ncbi:hypothetical protein AMTRI_Chr12g238970 [Amborella trichopoda]|uniref:VQ domain-containing protein n=1 Tax=Amborella trichopoda TaxID=13333 RepID=U5DDV7_AMBTC|nr:uncharacterized protein LOC18446945 [Amborella trichopoda]ERN18578.1 hypothetical protein AMTR_s00065p00127930 [Amborella trichopoda]|eukprot:XP_006857111.1 uncharacterized protein LOC18446945 [Amborella trichopoda]